MPRITDVCFRKDGRKTNILISTETESLAFSPFDKASEFLDIFLKTKERIIKDADHSYMEKENPIGSDALVIDNFPYGYLIHEYYSSGNNSIDCHMGITSRENHDKRGC